MTILVLAAHSDDEVLGCGGTIAKFAEEGEDIISIIFAEGDPTNLKHYISKDRARELAIRRRKESITAGKILGVKHTIFLGIPDNLFSVKFNDFTKNRVANLIKNLKPKIIFTHCPDDPHPMHLSISTFVKGLTKEYKIPVYTFAIALPLKLRQRNKPRLYIDISRTIRKKREALKQFKSQEHWLIYYRAIGFFRDKIAGMQSHHKYAEVFYKW